MHANVDQGKAQSSFGVLEEIKSLLMMQRVVVNSIIESDMWHDPSGYRVVHTDGSYTCPELGILLRYFSILLNGTVQPPWKGWDSDLMNLSKKKREGNVTLGALLL